MKVFLHNNGFKYETEKLCRIFLPFEKIEFVTSDEDADCTVSLEKGDMYNIKASLHLNGQYAEYEDKISPVDDKTCEKELAVLLYKCFNKITGYSSPWGILTGVRPAKLFNSVALKTSSENAESYFRNKLLVSDQKISLCKAAVTGENNIISLSKPNSFSLYIGIPFCPSRCSYCSFISHSVEQAKKLIPRYVQLLCEEIGITGEIAKQCGLKLETVYIGGGTPTTLSAEQLSEIMTAVRSNFDISAIREYTVEAGRPDTITKDKLSAIREGGADRISINPQTMNDEVLKNIGRAHTSQQTVDAFMLARECGFNNINTDLIAGLPGDDFESFKNTVLRVSELSPESVTVHTLCMKKSSYLTVNGEYPVLRAGEEASKMVEYARGFLIEKGLFPYYMYRQSKMVGNLENVGYAKPGHEGFYNVYIMDETHSILACGGSAVTKLRRYNKNEIERIYNFKYPFEYIDRFSEQITRKNGIIEFYRSI